MRKIIVLAVIAAMGLFVRANALNKQSADDLSNIVKDNILALSINSAMPNDCVPIWEYLVCKSDDGHKYSYARKAINEEEGGEDD